MPIGVIIADFILGLFVGVYALASFAPAHRARQVYQSCWLFGATFVGAAYLQTMTKSEFSVSALNSKFNRFSDTQVETLIIVVLSGIALAFIGGMLALKRLDREAS
jgi:hypothetical protein